MQNNKQVPNIAKIRKQNLIVMILHQKMKKKKKKMIFIFNDNMKHSVYLSDQKAVFDSAARVGSPQQREPEHSTAQQLESSRPLLCAEGGAGRNCDSSLIYKISTKIKILIKREIHIGAYNGDVIWRYMGEG